MNELFDPLAWVARAEEDFQMARSALHRKKPFTYSACFHAQQCVEKYLRAILVSGHSEFPKTHDLLLLSQLCEQSGSLIAFDAKRLDVLGSYAVRVRYPGEDPTPEETKQAVSTAKDFRRIARKLLNL